MWNSLNLKKLKPSRKPPLPGDIFVMLPPEDKFLYGRVISTDARIGPMENCILIYIHRVRPTKKLPVPELSLKDLLVPPMMTNKLPWVRGYFETIAHKDLQPEEILKQHCFRDSRGLFFDEHSNQLPGPIEPVGTWGLHSYQTIDDEISKALGLELSP